MLPKGIPSITNTAEKVSKDFYSKLNFSILATARIYPNFCERLCGLRGSACHVPRCDTHPQRGNVKQTLAKALWSVGA